MHKVINIPMPANMVYSSTPLVTIPSTISYKTSNTQLICQIKCKKVIINIFTILLSWAKIHKKQCVAIKLARNNK